MQHHVLSTSSGYSAAYCQGQGLYWSRPVFNACLSKSVTHCCSYSNPMPTPDDYAKEPPGMPPHLLLTLLNVPAQSDAAAPLPRPQHVVLNHLYCQRTSQGNGLVVGTTHRYKAKYVTTVMYKPKKRYQTAVDSGLQQLDHLPQQQQHHQQPEQLRTASHSYAATSSRPQPIPHRHSRHS